MSSTATPGPSDTVWPIGIDFGGTGIKAAPVDLVSGEFAQPRQRIDTPKPATPDAVAQVMRRLVDAFPDSTGPIGVCAPAVVRRGVCSSPRPTSTRRGSGVDADALLTERLERPVHVLNDADAAGYAELQYAPRRAAPGWSSSPRSAPASAARSSTTAASSPTPSSATSRSTATTPRAARPPARASARACRGRSGGERLTTYYRTAGEAVLPRPLRRRRRRVEEQREVLPPRARRDRDDPRDPAQLRRHRRGRRPVAPGLRAPHTIADGSVPAARPLALSTRTRLAPDATAQPPTPHAGAVPASRHASAAAGGPGAGAPARRAAPRPNVMVVMLDDMRFDELRFLPRTRAFVQDRGLTFTNGYSPYPLCCPARSSFLLGEYAHNHGVLYHEAPYGFGAIDDHRTIATSLSRAGYRTAMVGKYLNRYGLQPSKVTGRSSYTYVPNGWTDWMAGLDGKPQNHGAYPGSTYDYFHLNQNINGRPTSFPGRYSSDVIADEAAGLVGEYAAARPAKPWFMWLTPVAPHHGGPVEPDDPPTYVGPRGRTQDFVTPARPDWVKGRFDRQVPRGLGEPAHGAAEADLSDKPRLYRRQPEAGPVEKRELRDTERQRAEALYAWDRAFGRVIDRLRSTRQLGRTVVVFTSDNGYYNGEHRQRLGKIKPHEPVIRVPLLVAGPGIPHGVRHTPVTTFDLTATVLDLAGARRPTSRPMDGESKLDVLHGPDRGWTYPMLTEGLLTGIRRQGHGFTGGLNEVGIDTGRYKYVRYATGEKELYDLRTDPLELTSRIGDPAYADVQGDLDRMWREYKDCVGAACRAPMPRRYRLSVAELAAQHAYATTRLRQYYGGR
ncbi:hypothetical protein LUZ63_020372 [Rhynchospora breviuscula]|uniref:Sulfatase N-terminal domain-containing protein n=1 Tax=Rhynchospora breviuscula TaxID=2022672 RepID=A0A9Q0C116_9POAL|nr:hypothetical protein LUZ63_020372 [Rhynchospora breviuscula]